jgi:hypothetical protein
LQLDELRAAKRSPIGGADEDQHRPAVSHDRSQRLRFTGLVVQLKVGDLVSNLRSEPGDIDSRTVSLCREMRHQQDNESRREQKAWHVSWLRPAAQATL